MVFQETSVTSNIVYGNNIDSQGADVSLTLDVYEPVGDAETARPLIIMVHGGSFVGGSKEGADVVPFAQDFAKMGFVTASINYRLGFNIFGDLEQGATEAVMRGVHDFRAAVRYFRKNVEEDGNSYNIDPSQIYSAGVSAGGFITLHAAYMDEVSEIPVNIDQTLAGLTGGLEGDSGNPGYSSDVVALVNVAGAIKDTTWINEGDEPVCNFHGTGDSVVPFDTAMLLMLGIDVTEVDGSNAVDQQADLKGITNCFEIYEGQGHVPHVANSFYYDTTRVIMSNFFSHFVCPEIELDCGYREMSIVTGLEELQANVEVLVSPNPATDNFMINTTLPARSTVVLRSTQGRIVKQVQLGNSRQVSCLDLAPGVYLGTIYTDDQHEYFKIVVAGN
jgi:poly(3-hydroxybutyrate) depolymerase